MAFGLITSCFSVERDFRYRCSRLKRGFVTSRLQELYIFAGGKKSCIILRKKAAQAKAFAKTKAKAVVAAKAYRRSAAR